MTTLWPLIRCCSRFLFIFLRLPVCLQLLLTQMFRSVPPHICYLFRALVLITVFNNHRILAQGPQCRPELGTEINAKDCNMAASMLIKHGPGPVTSAEWARDRRFTISQHIAGAEDVGFVSRQEAYGTCELQVRMENDSDPVQTSWQTIFRRLALLLKTCVKDRGFGGEYTINGFNFVVEFSGRADASTSLILEDAPKNKLGPRPPSGRRPPPVALQQVPGAVRPFAPGTLQNTANELSSSPSVKEEHLHPPSRGFSTIGALRIMPEELPLPSSPKNQRPSGSSTGSPALGNVRKMDNELPLKFCKAATP